MLPGGSMMKGTKTIGSTISSTRGAVCICVDMKKLDVSWLTR